MNAKLELNNSKLKIEQLKIGFADNSKLKIQNSKLKNLNTKLELNNSKLKTEQLKIAYGDNSKLKIQNSKFKIALRATIQNSKFKTQNSKCEYKGKYRYVLGTEIYNRLSDAKVIIQAAAIPRRLAAHRAAMFRGLNISHSTFI